MSDDDEDVTVRRGRRRRATPRAVTLSVKHNTRASLREFSSYEYAAELEIERPRTRSDCLGGGANSARPCAFVSCRHHLYLDVNPETGTIKFNFPMLSPWDLKESCALDVAERGGLTLEETGELLNLTRERVRQIEVRGLLGLKGAPALRGHL